MHSVPRPVARTRRALLGATVGMVLTTAVLAPLSPRASAATTTGSPSPSGVYATGLDDHGELGDGAGVTTRSTFGRVGTAGSRPVLRSVYSGPTGSHALALDEDGRAYAWGDNTDGQLGDGSTTTRTSPVPVTGLPAGVTFTVLAVGGHHSVGLGSDGVAYSWGDDYYGQLGDGTTTDRSTPGAVSLPSGVRFTAVSAGGEHTLALGDDGRAYAWGFNRFGQLGDGTTTTRSTPVPVTGLPTGVRLTAVSAGGGHSLALGSDGVTYAWGYNNNGELGVGRTAGDRLTPVPVTTLPAGVRLTALSAGADHNLAQGSDGVTYAWGLNARGELGDGTTTDRYTPVAVTGLPAGVRLTTVAVGAANSLGLGSDGALYAWGYNADGELGDGTTTDRATPVRVTTVVGATAIAAGGLTSYVLVPNTATGAYATGYDLYGQLGDGTTDDRSTLRPVGAAGHRPTLRTVVSGGGSLHALGLGYDGVAYAWGSGYSGQLGDGTTNGHTAPAAVTGLPAGVLLTALAAGDLHSLGLGSDGNAYSWGSNGQGQLGDGSTTTRTAPVRVAGLPAGVRVTAVAAGAFHNLALTSDGVAYAWGRNNAGQLGDGTTTDRATAVPVTGLPAGVRLTSVAAGAAHSLGLGDDGKAYGWGGNTSGQVGDGTTTGRLGPTAVTGLPAAVRLTALAAGTSSSLGVGSDGRGYAWGDNSSGQLGDGTLTDRSTPVPVAGLPAGVTLTAVAGASLHSVGLGSDGLAYAWGDNSSGQLGDGSTTGRPVPAPMLGVRGVSSVGAGAGTSFVGFPDTTAPTASSAALPPVTVRASVPVSWSGADRTYGGPSGGVGSFDVRYRTAPPRARFGALQYPPALQATTARSGTVGVARGSTLCIAVRARDRAGNLSPWTADSCTAVPLDDRALTRSAGWTAATSSSDYAGTILTSTTDGATLTARDVQVRRVWLVATRGPGQGTVGVYSGSTLLRTISLASGTTTHRAVIDVGDLGAVATTTLTVKDLGSAPVSVDGLALSRR